MAGGPPLLYTIPSGQVWRYGRPFVLGGTLFGFVGADQWLMAKPPPTGFFDLDPAGAARQFVQMPIVLETRDLTGQLLDEWTKPQSWTIYAVNPDRHLLVVTAERPHNTCGRQYCASMLAINYQTKKVAQEWPSGPAGKPYFAEAGKTLCSVDIGGRESHVAQCFDIDSGKKIAEFTGFKGGDPADVTTHASRIALSHIDLIQGINEEFDKNLYKDRVIWDFRANKEVAEWVPAMQTSESYFKGGAQKATAWGPFAISPTGRHLAEGSNGILRIYELP